MLPSWLIVIYWDVCYSEPWRTRGSLSPGFQFGGFIPRTGTAGSYGTYKVLCLTFGATVDLFSTAAALFILHGSVWVPFSGVSCKQYVVGFYFLTPYFL